MVPSHLQAPGTWARGLFALICPETQGLRKGRSVPGKGRNLRGRVTSSVLWVHLFISFQPPLPLPAVASYSLSICL